MKIKPNENCIVCQKHRGTVKVPGGILYENDLVVCSHAQLWGEEKDHYLGHLFVEPRRHVAELGDLTEAEAREVGFQVSRMAKALTTILGVEHVYSFVIGDGCPHIHVHVIGRYPGAPREYWGPRVDEWPGAPRGGVLEIARVADQIRDFLKTNQASLSH